ncbi:hypothetical protein [Amycolatopsis thailandensis]|nr:hypothetical protein [Amycolatopsis thailandensis]
MTFGELMSLVVEGFLSEVTRRPRPGLPTVSNTVAPVRSGSFDRSHGGGHGPGAGSGLALYRRFNTDEGEASMPQQIIEAYRARSSAEIASEINETLKKNKGKLRVDSIAMSEVAPPGNAAWVNALVVFEYIQ